MISVESADHYIWGQGCDGWHLVRAEGLSVIQERMPPGTAEVRHAHRQARQFFFVLDGVLTMEIAGRREHIPPLHGVEIGPGVPHQALNETDLPVQFLVISQPPSHGDRVDENQEPRTKNQETGTTKDTRGLGIGGQGSGTGLGLS